MPNFSKQFQDEMRRLARKETKDDLERLKKDHVELRRAISNTKKQLSALEQLVARTSKRVEKVQIASHAPAAPKAPKAEKPGKPKEDGRTRVTSQTIIKQRERLGLTQGEFAALVGVTGQSIYQWEHKDGPLKFRGGAKDRINAVKSIGSREARRRLAELNVV